MITFLVLFRKSHFFLFLQFHLQTNQHCYNLEEIRNNYFVKYHPIQILYDNNSVPDFAYISISCFLPTLELLNSLSASKSAYI